MNGQTEEDAIVMLLRKLPKRSIPADLVLSIEAATVRQEKWWVSDPFRLRWFPALLGLATALGVLWLSKIQRHSSRAVALPVAARPAPRPEIVHALLSKSELPNQEKGESREHPKS